MNHSPVSNTCDQCRHWDNDGLSPYGVCRHSPPTGSGWPRVSRKDWCGEYGYPVVEAQPPYPVMNPLPLGETVEGTDFYLSPPEKRRPGRPKKETA